jgi:sulfur carrier protein
MKLSVQGEMREFPDAATLLDVLVLLGFDRRPGLAIAVNQSVVPAANWGDSVLQDGDELLLIQATQGG